MLHYYLTRFFMEDCIRQSSVPMHTLHNNADLLTKTAQLQKLPSSDYSVISNNYWKAEEMVRKWVASCFSNNQVVTVSRPDRTPFWTCFFFPLNKELLLHWFIAVKQKNHKKNIKWYEMVLLLFYNTKQLLSKCFSLYQHNLYYTWIKSSFLYTKIWQLSFKHYLQVTVNNNLSKIISHSAYWI